MVWKPDVTVAALVERDGLFLVVEERIGERVVLNQPAGHIEHGETILQAVVRETLEETAWRFIPLAVLGACIIGAARAVIAPCASPSPARSRRSMPSVRSTPR